LSRFAAIVLAGDRRVDDPLAQASGHGCKALLEIAGQPMLLRVLDALGASASVEAIHLSGPSEASLAGSAALRARLDQGWVRWHAPGPTPSTSALGVLATIDPAVPVLLTTADHPLLRPQYIDHFCASAGASGADALVGVAPYALVREIFPTMRKTLLRFRDEAYCGCNLFAFPSAAGRAMAERWREVEAARKTPWRVIGLLGWDAVLRYRLGWLSLDAAMQLLSRRTGLRVQAVRLPFGEAAVDVDSLEDHALVEARLRERES
jgi:GTP:adenosylcobinamide-phosphate guanylyltransferase